MATDFQLKPVDKILIEYNNKNLEENNEEEKKVIDIEFTKQIVDSENAENVIDFKWLYIRREDEEDISQANLNKS